MFGEANGTIKREQNKGKNISFVTKERREIPASPSIPSP